MCRRRDGYDPPFGPGLFEGHVARDNVKQEVLHSHISDPNKLAKSIKARTHFSRNMSPFSASYSSLLSGFLSVFLSVCLSFCRLCLLSLSLSIYLYPTISLSLSLSLRTSGTNNEALPQQEGRLRCDVHVSPDNMSDA